MLSWTPPCGRRARARASENPRCEPMYMTQCKARWRVDRRACTIMSTAAQARVRDARSAPPPIDTRLAVRRRWLAATKSPTQTFGSADSRLLCSLLHQIETAGRP